MKPFVFSFLACFLLLGFSLSGQDWHPLPNSGVMTYTYESTVDSNTWFMDLEVESIVQQGTDTAYFLNRICRFAPSGGTRVCGQSVGIYTDYFAYEPGSWGNKMLARPNGDYLFVGCGPDSFLVKTQPLPGNTWEFTPGDTATLTAIVTDTFLGVVDSVMHISLSSGRELHISKQYGMINSFNFLPFYNQNKFLETHTYQLWGIPEAGIGDTLPGYWEIYDFEVSDHWQIHYMDQVVGYPSDAYVEDFVLDSVNGNSSQMTYYTTAEKVEWVSGIPYYYPPAPKRVVINSPLFCDELSESPFASNPAVCPNRPPAPVGVHTSDDWGGRITRYFFHGNYNYQDSSWGFFDPLNHASYYAEGLGKVVFIDHYDYTATELFQMICFDNGQLSFGTCRDLSSIVSLEEERETNPGLTVFPNPFLNEINLRLNEELAAFPLQLNLFSAQGNRVLSQDFPGGSQTISIPASDLPAGIYFFSLYSEGELLSTGNLLK